MVFLKKGINKAAGKYIYPHPSQTDTGNCAAYCAASCLYAFGLDHESALIPPAEGSQSDDAKFQFQISKMIERFQELIYGEPKNSQAEAFRKYINEKGLNCKFDVSEPPLTINEYDHIAGKYLDHSNVFHMLEEAKRCQNVIMNIEWKKDDGTIARHAVGLVGGEGNALLINNPWGTAVHTNPDDAAKNTEDKKPDNSFTSVPMKGDDKGNIFIPIKAKEAKIYAFLMVCPAQPHPVSINSRVRPGTMFAAKRIEYEVANKQLKLANGLAIELQGFSPENVLGMVAPPGWKSSIWYRENEPGFDKLAPEIVVDPNLRTFAGVMWRCEKGGIRKGKKLSGFSVELNYPKLDPSVAEWHEDPQGHGIVLEEGHGNTGAWHINAKTPVKIDLAKVFNHKIRDVKLRARQRRLG